MDVGTATDSVPVSGVDSPTNVQWSAPTEDEKRATWTKLRKYYEPRLGQGVTVQSLDCDHSWFASRSADYIDEFILLSWEELLVITGLGKKKRDLLLKIFSDAMSRDPQSLADEGSRISKPSPSPIENPRLLSKLTDLAIPATFPISLCRFSGRVKESCKNANAATVDGWRDRHEKRRLQPEVIREWINSYNYQLKFVIVSHEDLEEVQYLISSVGSEIKSSKVLLMPEGIESDIIRSRTTTLVDICKRHGYRYCNRLHIELFGNTKGT